MTFFLFLTTMQESTRRKEEPPTVKDHPHTFNVPRIYTLKHLLFGNINIGIYTGFIFMRIETATSAE